MYTMGVKQASGTYHCFRCGSKGNWYNFKDKIMQLFYGKSLGQLVGNSGESLGSMLTSSFQAEDSSRVDAVNAKYDVK
jgi:DNA primase